MTPPNANELATQAQFSLQNGQFSEAERLYAELCTLDENNEEVWLMHAVASAEAGFIENALDSASKAIELDPTYVEAYLTKAHLLQRLDRSDEAIEITLKAVEQDDEYAEAWLFIAGLAGKLHRAKDCESWSRKVLTLMPENTDALINLANALYEQENYSEAAAEYKKVVDKQPGSTLALIGLAKANLALTNFDDAIKASEAVISRQSNNLEALNCLGLSYLHTDQYTNALETFEKISDLDDQNESAYLSAAKTHINMGDLESATESLLTAKILCEPSSEIFQALAHVYLERGMTYAALECYEDILDIEPENALIQFHIALIQAETGSFDEALEILDDIDDAELHAKVVGAKANIFERLGNYEEAHQLIKSVITQEDIPASVANAYANLCHRFDDCDDTISLLNKKLSQNDYSERDNRLLLYSLGNIYDRRKEYDEAFANYDKANKLKPVNYNHDDYIKTIDQYIEEFSHTDFSTIPTVDSSEQPYQPIFIVGMLRSGTSLIEQILSSHPNVFGCGERMEVTDIANKIMSLSETDAIFNLENLTEDDLVQATDYYFSDVDIEASSSQFITDKMPTNFQFLPIIHSLFPNAKIIHSVRNPIDTCLSCYFQEFTGFHDYTYNLENMGKHYLEYLRLIKYYKEELKIPMLDVQYEDLVNDSESITRKILNYCNLDWNDACMEFYKSDRLSHTASYNQVREPIYNRSIERWKNYESHIKDLTAILEKHR